MKTEIRLGIRALAFAALSICGLRSATAQEAFGGGTQTLWVSAWEFVHGSDGYMSTLAGNVQYMAPSVSTGVWRGPLRLPAGAQLDGLRCYYYSNGDATRPQARVAVYDFDLITKTQDAIIMNPVTCPQAIGYHEPEVAISPSADTLVRYHPSDTNHRYSFILLNHSDPSDGFRGCEVTWHRTVSDAPASSTFADVEPGNPSFQAIEALAAAGVTAGCDDEPNFCPDHPVTRGQLAVFLAKALGLHWPD